MPFRFTASPLATVQQQHHLFLSQAASCPWPRRRRQLFHSTSRLCDDRIDKASNHYETLKLQPGATPAEVKKSFYALSKTHHPDVNRNDPGAANRFMRISEAYSILSVPAKRAVYDRDTLGRSSSSSHGRRGSYSSTGPAGGRPASGLSKRRGTYQGPPPSFYRSGGWGTHSAKRQAAHDDSTGGGASAGSSRRSDAGGDAAGSQQTYGGSGGMGMGQDPFRDREDDLPYFDKQGHRRTGENIDARRASRRAAADGHGESISLEPERGMASMFFIIGGVVAVSFLGPFLISKIFFGGNEKKTLKKGTLSSSSSSSGVDAR